MLWIKYLLQLLHYLANAYMTKSINVRLLEIAFQLNGTVMEGKIALMELMNQFLAVIEWFSCQLQLDNHVHIVVIYCSPNNV